MLLLVASLAWAEDPAPTQDTDTGDAPAPAPGEPTTTPAPTPPAAPPVFDVEVVKKGAPGGDITPTGPAPPPRPVEVQVVKPAPIEVIDVKVVRPGEPAAVPPPAAAPPAPAPTTPAPTPAFPAPNGGGNITPPPLPVLPPVALPKPPTEAPPVVPSVTIPPGSAEAVPVVLPPPEPPPPVAAPALPAFVPGVGLRVEVEGEAPYRVVDASGRRYTTVKLARLVQDKATLTRLDRRRTNSEIGRITAGITGGALMIAGIAVVASDAGAPDTDDYAVEPSLYDTEAAYEEAVSFARGQYDKATFAWQQQRLGTTLFLVGSGGIALAAAPFIGKDDERFEELPHLVYDREQIDRMVADYNTLHPANPPADPSAPPADAPPAADAPATDAPPPEAAPGDVAPPPAAPTPVPGRPDPNQGLPDAGTFDEPGGIRLQPLWGAAWFGLRGTF